MTIIHSAEYNRTRKWADNAYKMQDTVCCGKRTYTPQTVMVPDGRIICEAIRFCNNPEQWQKIVNANAGD